MPTDRDLHGAAQSLYRYVQGQGVIKLKDSYNVKQPTPEEAQRMIDKFHEQYKNYEPALKAMAKNYDVKFPHEDKNSQNTR